MIKIETLKVFLKAFIGLYLLNKRSLCHFRVPESHKNDITF